MTGPIHGGTVTAVQITHFGHSCLLARHRRGPAALRPRHVLRRVRGASPGWTRCSSPTSTPTTSTPTGSRPLLDANPDARLVVDAGTAEQLAGIPHEVVAPGASLQVGGSRIDVLGGSTR